jgi:hypothetical protein
MDGPSRPCSRFGDQQDSKGRHQSQSDPLRATHGKLLRFAHPVVATRDRIFRISDERALKLSLVFVNSPRRIYARRGRAFGVFVSRD